MRQTKTPRWLLTALAAFGLMGAVNRAANAQTLPPSPTPPPMMAFDQAGSVIVPIQGSVRFKMKTGLLLKNADVDKPGIVLISRDPSDPHYVVVKGLNIGLVKITLTDEKGNTETYEVLAVQDVELLRRVLKRAVPMAAIDVIPVGPNAVLVGNAPRLEDARLVMEIARRVIIGPDNVIDAIQIGGVQQVQLDVTIARVDRSKLRQRGVNFIVGGTTFSTGSILGGLTSVQGAAGSALAFSSGVGITSAAVNASPTAANNLVFGIVPAQFNGLIQALKSENMAKTLAEPKLVTQSGRSAHFLSGGKQATLSAASGVNGPGVVYEDIGTELSFLPIVYGNGKIYLDIEPRIRSVDQGLGITTSFGSVPGFDEETLHTSVLMESGQTFALGGLIQTSTASSRIKVPVLGDIPFLGALFSVASDNIQEQELVIMVTPHLVDPMDCGQVPKKLPGLETRPPDDFEFYLETMMELPRGQRNVFEGLHYKAPWKVDPTANTFPCGLNGSAGAAGCASGKCGVAAVPAVGVQASGSAIVPPPPPVLSMPAAGKPSPSQLPPATPVPATGR